MDAMRILGPLIDERLKMDDECKRTGNDLNRPVRCHLRRHLLLTDRGTERLTFIFP
jgi:hypothetical protein